MTARRRALISVSDKQGVVEFAKGLAALSYELLSTGGTAKVLRDAGVAVTDVSSVTGFPEIMDGRVKTLHPAIHGGLLARRGVDDATLAEHGIGFIDVLAVNLYPFAQVTADPGCSAARAVENIDIGGPAMLRAAAKNHDRITVVVDAADYDIVLGALRNGDAPPALKRELAVKAFAHTARYDATIARYLHGRSGSAEWPDPLVLAWQQPRRLHYGENPHQRAALYRSIESSPGSAAQAAQLQGKPLSFNNLVDADAALQCAKAFADAACVIVKHANPCGVAVAEDAATAYREAYRADATSAFGGVIAFNRPLDGPTAEAIVAQQKVDVLIAPLVDAGARTVLARRPGTRVLEAGLVQDARPAWETKSLEGGLLVQERDLRDADPAELRTVTERTPSAAELRDLRFAWQVVRFVKSNAIVYARDNRTLGIGAGQMSRVMSTRIAALKAAEEGLPLQGAVMASDAFFPFRDGLDVAAEHGIGAVIQPGGSIRDGEIIDAANEHGMAMVFTGIRHFRH